MSGRADDEGRDLRARWLAAGYPVEPFEILLDKYREAHRQYHCPEHLRSMFHLIDVDDQARAVVSRLSPVDRRVLELAVWYHDREYRPERHDNEERSARQFADDAPRLGLDAQAVARVVDLILLSRHHRPPEGDDLAALFCDLDLAILGTPPEVFDAYRRAVRREYAHLSDLAWEVGRRRFLRQSSSRPALFHFLRDREPIARANLAREVADLGPPTARHRLLDFLLGLREGLRLLTPR